MPGSIFKNFFTSRPAEAKEINAKKATLSADLVHPGNNGEMT